MASIHHPRFFEFTSKNFVHKLLFDKFKLIKHEPKWFYQLKSSIHYSEKDLQRTLAIRVAEQLPSYGVIYFDLTIQSTVSPFDRSIPDLLLWKKDYSEWYLIEVELEHHTISHIKKQIENFYNGDYSDVKKITDYVASKFTGSFNIQKFTDMISSQRPKIMLIADEIKENWRKEFSNMDCYFGTIQVYSDDNDNHIFRIGGDFPQEYSKYSYCNLNKGLRSLEIADINFCKYFNGKNTIEIFFQDICERWDFDGNRSIIFNGASLALDTTIKRWKIIINNKNQFHILKG